MSHAPRAGFDCHHDDRDQRLAPPAEISVAGAGAVLVREHGVLRDAAPVTRDVADSLASEMEGNAGAVIMATPGRRAP